MLPPHKISSKKSHTPLPTASDSPPSPSSSTPTSLKQRTSTGFVKITKLRSLEDLCKEYDDMKIELKGLKRTYEKTEKGVERIMGMGEDVTELRVLVGELSSSMDTTTSLMARTVAITSEIKNRVANNNLGEETITKFAKRWRLLLFGCGLLSIELALIGHYFGEGFSKSSYKWGATSYIFDVFSMTCLSAAAGSNPERIFWSIREKLFVTLCGVCMGASYLLRGDWLKGTFAVFVTPITFQAMARMYATIPEKQLNDALIHVFKMLPFTLLLILYVGVTSLKCVLNSVEPDEKYGTDECAELKPGTHEPHGCYTVWEQCENPLLPAKLVCWFFWVTFILAQIRPIVVKKERLSSWQNIISMTNLSVSDIVVSVLYFIQTLLALACQALTNLEQTGSEMTSMLSTVTWAFQIHLALFLVVCVALAFLGRKTLVKKRGGGDRFGPDSFLRDDTSGVARGDDAL
ncbi:hypothetical protein TrLO_g12050 [Triparma laevis f. longispina]|uniref:Uncharacterized protein n=1 Tax=Triparma laevis f. longispina TaxID=1714387 RepID=A0A9W7AQ31_9STRA|nr:hypothetical protein TrLO_g12050 [Triparma laevis f. longispina]